MTLTLGLSCYLLLFCIIDRKAHINEGKNMSDKKSKLKIVKTKASEDNDGRICSFCGKNSKVVFVGPNKATICESCVQNATKGSRRNNFTF